MTGILVSLQIHEKLALSGVGKNHIKDPRGKTCKCMYTNSRPILWVL